MPVQESFPVIVKEKFPQAISFPVMTPVVGLNVKLPGNVLPFLSVYLYGARPPAILTGVLYLAPKVPTGRLGNVTHVRGSGGRTVTVKVAFAI